MVTSTSSFIPGVQTTPTTQSTTQTENTATGAVQSDEFMLLLLTELRNQNPLEPMQDKDLMAQITQINSLQELQKINTNLESANRSNQLTEAASLIGKVVKVAQDDDSTLTGVVTGVSMVNDQIMLWMNDQTVPLASLITIQDGGTVNG